MKYKLLKDLPYAKAGEVFERVIYKSKDGLSDCDYLKISRREKDSKNETIFTVYYNHFLGNFDEWFEEIKEPTSSIHWKPKLGDEVFFISSEGHIVSDIFNDTVGHHRRLIFGCAFRTLEEATRVRDRRLAEARLRQTSDFNPYFEDANGGWAIRYDYCLKELFPVEISGADYGEIVRYATRADAKKSIEENREDWKIYFGIEEEK